MCGAAKLPFVCAFTIAVVFSLQRQGAAQGAEFIVDVRTYVQARARFSLAAATREASAIMRRAGVKTRWRDCTDNPACTQMYDSAELIIRIKDGEVLPGERASDQMVLGEAMLDDSGRGVFADVMVARVLAFVRRAPAQRDRMLGRVLAHEISHLLLGNRNHTPAGLMRRVWLPGDIEFPNRWLIASPQREQLADLVARRRLDHSFTSALPLPLSVPSLAR
jgi:hypothetical protein